VLGEKDPWTSWVHLRPLSLNYWLRGLDSSSINVDGGVEHELRHEVRI